MDEMEFALKVVVYSLFVEIALFVFAQAIGGTPAGVHSPAVATMVSYQNAINASARVLYQPSCRSHAALA